jgi:hypothetical protein
VEGTGWGPIATFIAEVLLGDATAGSSTDLARNRFITPLEAANPAPPTIRNVAAARTGLQAGLPVVAPAGAAAGGVATGVSWRADSGASEAAGRSSEASDGNIDSQSTSAGGGGGVTGLVRNRNCGDSSDGKSTGESSASTSEP